MMALEMALSAAWKHWRLILEIASVAVLGFLLVLAKSDARHWQKVAAGYQLTIETMQRLAAEQEAANQKRVADAVQAYADRTAALQPIIVKSREVVKQYAATPAGRAECLSSGIVRDIEAFDSAVKDPSAAHGSAGTVPDTGTH